MPGTTVWSLKALLPPHVRPLCPPQHSQQPPRSAAGFETPLGRPQIRRALQFHPSPDGAPVERGVRIGAVRCACRPRGPVPVDGPRQRGHLRPHPRRALQGQQVRRLPRFAPATRKEQHLPCTYSGAVAAIAAPVPPGRGPGLVPVPLLPVLTPPRPRAAARPQLRADQGRRHLHCQPLRGRGRPVRQGGRVAGHRVPVPQRPVHCSPRRLVLARILPPWYVSARDGAHRRRQAATTAASHSFTSPHRPRPRALPRPDANNPDAGIKVKYSGGDPCEAIGNQPRSIVYNLHVRAPLAWPRPSLTHARTHTTRYSATPTRRRPPSRARRRALRTRSATTRWTGSPPWRAPPRPAPRSAPASCSSAPPAPARPQRDRMPR